MAAMLITLFLIVLMVALVLWGIGVLLIPVYLGILVNDWAARHEMAKALDEEDHRHDDPGKGRA